MFFIALAACLFQLISAGTIQVQNCGTASGTVLDFVDVSGCSSLPCVLIKGTEASIKVGFTSSFYASYAKLDCSASVFLVTIPAPLEEDNVCKLGAKCPIQSGDYNEVSVSIEIKKIYPSVSATIQCKVFDQDKKAKICIKLPVKIQNSFVYLG